jgi:hypothetical protein
LPGRGAVERCWAWLFLPSGRCDTQRPATLYHLLRHGNVRASGPVSVVRMARSAIRTPSATRQPRITFRFIRATHPP